jgi:sugar lactone lactonase YvrE
MSTEFSLVLDAQCALGESPVWWAEAKLLVFIDITGRRLHRFDPVSKRHDVLAIDEDIGCVAPAKGGGYVAGLRSGIWLLDANGAKVRQLAANPRPTASTTGASTRRDATSRARSMSRRRSAMPGCFATTAMDCSR